MVVIHSVTQLGFSTQSRVLVIMPHPDDEAVFASGLIADCTHQNVPIRVVTCTRGEKSTLRHGLSPAADLAVCRARELRTALAILRVADADIWEVPDGKLEQCRKKLHHLLYRELQTYRPTDILVLEPDGVYGHPDHIALTQAVEHTTEHEAKTAQIWYLTVAPWYRFPSGRAMAKKSSIQPVAPEYCYRLALWQIWLKFLALAAHRSQFKLMPWQGTTFGHFWHNSTWWSEFLTKKV